MNVYQLDDMSWQYQYADRILEADTLKDLEVLVRLYGLKWKILDEKLALKSQKTDKNNITGFKNVYKNDDMWYYRGSALKSMSLEGLKRKVLENDLEWKKTDESLAYKNWKLDRRKFQK